MSRQPAFPPWLPPKLWAVSCTLSDCPHRGEKRCYLIGDEEKERHVTGRNK